jgi:hypothetical protein
MSEIAKLQGIMEQGLARSRSLLIKSTEIQDRYEAALIRLEKEAEQTNDTEAFAARCQRELGHFQEELEEIHQLIADELDYLRFAYSTRFDARIKDEIG